MGQVKLNRFEKRIYEAIKKVYISELKQLKKERESLDNSPVTIVKDARKKIAMIEKMDYKIDKLTKEFKYINFPYINFREENLTYLKICPQFERLEINFEFL